MDINEQNISLYKLRYLKFKTIKRGYYSLVILIILYLLSFLLPFFIGPQALVVKYKDNYYFPVISNILKKPPLQANHFGQSHAFGKERLGEVHYRALKEQFKKENDQNWVLMPLIPYGPNENLLDEIEGNPPISPNKKHWFGTDNRGRDVLARLFYAFRISISFALIVTSLSYLIGTLIGACLGYFGSYIDLLGVRIIEVISAIPFLYMSMVLVSILKPSFWLLAFILVFLAGWIPVSYYVRAEYLREKKKPYVFAALNLGLPTRSILFKHILPNALTPIIAFAPFAIIGNISALVALDFLSLGLPPPTPSWGELLSQGTQNIKNWWLVLAPLSALFFTLLSITFIGEGVREAFDPKNFERFDP